MKGMSGEIEYRQSGRSMANYGALPPQIATTQEVLNGSHAEQGTQACPTCRGTGRIHRDQEHELVALIPLRDKRLKPRRTTLYVCIAVMVCLLVAGLLMFFLLPRSVEVASNVHNLVPLSVNISVKDQYVRLYIRNEYNISNQNFFPITIKQMEVRVLFDETVMVDTENKTLVQVPLRSSVIYSLDFNITFKEDLGYLAYFCNRASKFGHTLWMPFQATATTSYYGHTEEATLSIIQQVQCSGRSSDLM